MAVQGFFRPGSVQRRFGPAWLGDTISALTALWWVSLAATVLALVFVPEVLLFAMLDSTWGPSLITGFLLYAVFWFGLAVATAVRVWRIGNQDAASDGEGRGHRTRAVATLGIVTTIAILASSGVATVAAAGIHAARSTASVLFTAEPAPESWNGRWNIALLGGDAGIDRDGRRIDSINVLSLDLETGDAAVITIPRGLQQIPLSAGSPLLNRWSSGTYDCGHACQLGFLYPYGETTWAPLFAGTVPAGSSPGVESLRDGLEGLLELPINAYVMIDYDGFAELVDSLGGVVVNVEQRLPVGGDQNLVGVIDWVEAGEHRLSGYEAMWYVRSRMSTSEPDRIHRQGQVFAAILDQTDLWTLLRSFRTLGPELVQTDISSHMLPALTKAARRTDHQSLRVLSLATHAVDLEHPDLESLRSAVRELLYPDEG